MCHLQHVEAHFAGLAYTEDENLAAVFRYYVVILGGRVKVAVGCNSL